MKFHTLILLLAITIVSRGQTILPERRDSAESVKEKSFGRLSASYANDYYYMGRSDSVKAPYLTFSSGYYHKSGFFVRGSLSYLTARENGRVDLYTITGGYDYFGKRLFAGAFLSAYFFNASSYSVQSEMNAYLNGFVGYDFYYVTIIADASAGFSDNTDFFLGAEVNHAFYAFRDKLRITPSFYMAAGSQYYYDQYYANRSMSTGKGKGKGNGFGQSTNSDQSNYSDIYIQGSEKFEIMNYEASVELSYKIKTLRFLFIPAFTFPVNPSTIVINGIRYKEDLSNGFYWSAGVRYVIY